MWELYIENFTTLPFELPRAQFIAETGGYTEQKCGNSPPQLPGGLESSNKKITKGY